MKDIKNNWYLRLMIIQAYNSFHMKAGIKLFGILFFLKWYKALFEDDLAENRVMDNIQNNKFQTLHFAASTFTSKVQDYL